MKFRPARFLFVLLLGTVATVLGIVTSMTLTPPGRDLLARVVSAELDRVVNGTIDVGRISGSFLSSLILEDVVVRDTQGVLLAALPRARVSYSIPRLLGGDIVLGELEADRATIHIIQHHSGRMNYADVLRLGEGEPRTGPAPLVMFRNVRLRDATLRIAMPWRPRPEWTPAQLDSALAFERAKPGRIIEETPEGYRRVIALEDLTTVMSRLLISSPEGRPFTLDLDSLAARISDPAVTVTALEGRVRLRGDSAIFSLEHGSLPGTDFTGGGAVTWPQDTILYDFQLESPRVDLADLRWVSPDFPGFTGSGVMAAKSITGRRTEYVLQQLDLGRGAERVTGDLVAILDKDRGLGFRDMDLILTRFDLDHARPYADTLPFYGTVSGTLAGTGWLDRMQIAVDWDFADAKVAGNPVSSIVAQGVVGFRQPEGLYFDRVRLRQSNIDLGTVERIAPAVKVPGRLEAVGTLNGPMRNVTFVGNARHHDGDRPVSAFTGQVRLDTRGEVLGVDLDVALEPLDFEGIRRGFPGLATTGEVRGRLAMSGTLEQMQVDADLTGEIGTIRAVGGMTMMPPRWGADALSVQFSGLDLQALQGKGVRTSLTGSALASGTIDSMTAPEGSLELVLRRSAVREWTIDTLFARAAAADSIITVDTLYTEWEGARAGGAGTLGWAAPHEGVMSFRLAADSLVAFDSLLLALTGDTRDSARHWEVPLAGTATGALALSGNLDSLAVVGSFDARDLAFQGYRSPRLSGSFGSAGGDGGRVHLDVRADSFTVQPDTVGTPWSFDSLGLVLDGTMDSVSWSAGTGVGNGPRFDGAGWLRLGDSMLLGIDTLRADLAPGVWRLLQPTTFALGDSAPLLDTTVIAALDRSGEVRVAGRLPFEGAGDMTIDAFGLDLKSLYAIAGHDPGGVQGRLSGSFQLGGTKAEPTFTGSAQLDGLAIGDSHLPYLAGVLNYADRRLNADIMLWRTGNQVMTLEAAVPYYLGASKVENRRLDGPVSIRALGDSVDLAIIEPFVPSVDRVTGFLDADVTVGGTWADPALSGFLTVQDGGMIVRGLNVEWEAMEGSARFVGDSVLVENLRVTSGEGALGVNGVVRLEELSRPVLNLDLVAQNFEAIQQREFLDLTASGRFRIAGPFFGATLTGSGVANEGVLYFADLLNKQVIDLEDPTNLDLVDTLAIRRQRLGEGIQNQFVEELRIEDFNLQLGSDFWLRSSEANIKLTGEVRANKVRREYRMDGVLEAGPGTYTLKIGPVSRDFDVQRGSVTYFGTPDLNAGLDIEAQHVVRAESGQDIPVIARITGTLLRPELELRSDPTIQPPLPEVDLVSYLVFGIPSSQVSIDRRQALSSFTSIVTASVSSDLERAIVSDLGIPVDLLEIRPVLAGGVSGGSALQLAAGWQVGRDLFVRLNAGVCQGVGGNSPVGFGASLDYRLSRAWRLQTSFEPTYRDCRVLNQFQPTNTYQIGFDILWENEF